MLTFWHAAKRACPIAAASLRLTERLSQLLSAAEIPRLMLLFTAAETSTVIGFAVDLSYDRESASVKMSFIDDLPFAFFLIVFIRSAVNKSLCVNVSETPPNP